MTDLRELNSAVQDSAFPSVQFAQAVREWIAAATERMEPASEGGKVECPNCNQEIDRTRRTLDHLHPDSNKHGLGPVYVCKPAQPEPIVLRQASTDASEAPPSETRTMGNAQPDPAAPVENIVLDGATATRRKRELEEAVAAPVNAGRAVRRFGRMLSGLGGGEPVAPVEMPEWCPECGEGNKCWAGPLPVDGAISNLRYAAKNPSVSRDEAERMYKVACNLAHFWRTHSQPAPVRMSAELENILSQVTCTALHFVGQRVPTIADAGRKLLQAIAAVRSQAAEVRVKLPKVRAYFDSLCKLPQYRNEQGRDFLEGVYAELDAAERV